MHIDIFNAKITRKCLLQVFFMITIVVLVGITLMTPGIMHAKVRPRVGNTCAPAVPADSCISPDAMRRFYGIDSLFQKGYRGRGQTVVVIVSFGSSTLQSDLDTFSRQYDLPLVHIDQRYPLGKVDNDSWVMETTLDVEMIHAVAPEANIVVLASPVAETEGVVGFAEFLKLEQYAVTNKLGTIINHSYGAGELSLDTPEGRKLVNDYAAFYHQATISQKITFLASSGDTGARDYVDDQTLSQDLNISFPNDVPWVTSVGGTSVLAQHETAWSGSGGGYSRFFPIPDYQQKLPPAQKGLLHGKRGVPDISAVADPVSSMEIYMRGSWFKVGGTSASSPLFAGIMAVANQYAGHALGFINPALYALGASQDAVRVYRDIREGNNTFTNQAGQTLGYHATAGWDAVTGWGTPHADAFIPALVRTIG